MFGRGLDIAAAHPIQEIAGDVTGLGREIAGPGTETIGRFFGVGTPRALGIALGTWLAAFWLVVGVGVWRALRTDRRRLLGHAFTLGLVAYILVASAGPQAFARFRAPVTPVLALYAGLGAIEVWHRCRHHTADASFPKSAGS